MKTKYLSSTKREKRRLRPECSESKHRCLCSPLHNVSAFSSKFTNISEVIALWVSTLPGAYLKHHIALSLERNCFIFNFHVHSGINIPFLAFTAHGQARLSWYLTSIHFLPSLTQEMNMIRQMSCLALNEYVLQGNTWCRTYRTLDIDSSKHF